MPGNRDWDLLCGASALTAMEGETHSRKVPRLTEEEDALDAELWGELQEHIPLQLIYEKLPQQDRSRLRVVCKDWNDVALQRLLPKPYFVTITSGFHYEDDARNLNGVITFDVASGQCKFQHQRFSLPHLDDRVPPFEVEGLILCHNPERGVFNAHNQTWHAIPPAPKESELCSPCGLMVDTTLQPYTFKLIQGNIETETQIYDSKSRSWSTTSSRMLSQAVAHELENDTSYTCMCHNGEVYISLNATMILKYSMEEDKWTTLDFPVRPYWEKSINSLGFYWGEHNTMGVWEGRIFTVTNEVVGATVWELVDPKQGKWVEYARMSKKQYNWLYEHNNVNSRISLAGLRLLSSFGHGYLLVCCWQWSNARADALVLFNMRKKKWKQVDLPMGTVATYDSDFEPISPRWSEGSSSTSEDTDSAADTELTEDFDTEDW